MAEQDDYRPKSPDLNFDDEEPQQQPQQPQQQQMTSPPPPQPPHHHQQSHQPLRIQPPAQSAQYANWYQSPQQPQPQDHSQHSRSYSYSNSAQSPNAPFFNPYQSEPQYATTPTSYNSPGFAPPAAYYQQTFHEPQPFSPTAPSGYPQQQPAYPNAYQPSPYAPPQQHHPQQHGYGQPSYVQSEDDRSIHVKPEPQDNPNPASNMPPRRSAAAAAALAAAAEPPALDPSPVKTKFPTARIKRIMQNDEEVGKVAQQTPIAVGKALEMFMIQLVSKSAEVARDKNSKRVTPAMLKTVIETDDQWDFLREIASKVEPDKEGGGGGSKGKAAATKAETESDEEEEEEEEEVKPVRRRGGRKKKAPA